MGLVDARVKVVISKGRLDLLSEGKPVKLTQGKTKFLLVPIAGCCVKMAKAIKRRKFRKLVEKFSVCPFCGEPLSKNKEVPNGTVA